MKATIFTVLVLFSATTYAMSVDEAKKILSSKESIEKTFELNTKRTSSLDINYFNNKKFSIVSAKDDQPGSTVAVIKDLIMTIDGQSTALNVKGNIINMDEGSEICKNACLVLPKDLKNFDGVIPGIMVIFVSYFGPAVPQYVPVIVTVDDLIQK
jgi:hypothetical protein